MQGGTMMAEVVEEGRSVVVKQGEATRITEAGGVVVVVEEEIITIGVMMSVNVETESAVGRVQTSSDTHLAPIWQPSRTFLTPIWHPSNTHLTHI